MFVIIRRKFKHLDGATFHTLYKALVRPYLEYANSVWCPYKSNHIEMIEKVQKKKQLPGMNYLPNEKRHQLLNLQTLPYRRIRGYLIELYKITNNIYHSKVTTFMKFKANEEHSYRLREHSKTIQLQATSKHNQPKLTKCRFEKYWNVD